MARPGWFKLWRKLDEHWLWEIKPFSPGQAWVDLMIRANFSEKARLAPGTRGPTNVAPGEAIVSLRLLEAKWGWSRHRVRRFLTRLRDDTMIEWRPGTSHTRIKILNWNTLQGHDGDNGTTKKEGDGTTIGTGTGPVPAPLRGQGRHPLEEVKKERKKEVGGGEAGRAASPAAPPLVLADLELYAADSTLCRALPKLLPQWAKAYPGIDVTGEIRKAHVWELANPTKRKVDRPRFLNTWLGKAQDNSGRQAPAKLAHGPVVQKAPEGPKCARCNGVGLCSQKEHRDGYGDVDASFQCPDCGGKGWLNKDEEARR